MLDASGFVRRSKVFAGNVREHRTLAGMLEALEAPVGALVVMDRGVATDACVTWLRDNGYRYLVVSRERHRRFDADACRDGPDRAHAQGGPTPTKCASEERTRSGARQAFRLPLRDLTKLNDGWPAPARTSGSTRSGNASDG